MPVVGPASPRLRRVKRGQGRGVKVNAPEARGIRIKMKTLSEIGESRWDADWREVEGGRREGGCP